jgi:hypothetical protein
MEEIEVPTEHLHEKIHEKAEEKKDRWTLYVALSTALMAVLAAVASLLAGHHANEALDERVKASDQWNYYQAKGVKQEIAINTEKILQAVGAARTNGAAGLPGSGNSIDIARYEKEKAEIKKKAEEYEQASQSHASRHVPLASAVTAFQIAIAISAIAILTRRKNLWYGSLCVTAIGAVFLAQGLF